MTKKKICSTCTVRELIVARLTERYGPEAAKEIDRAVQACIKREDGFDGMYAEAYWRLFVKDETVANVVASFKRRLLWFKENRAAS